MRKSELKRMRYKVVFRIFSAFNPQGTSEKTIAKNDIDIVHFERYLGFVREICVVLQTWPLVENRVMIISCFYEGN